jgi:hypothetical protein
MPVTNDPTKSDPKARDMIIVDLGTKRTKQIKQLRKGKGKLLDKVHQVIEELKASNSISGTVQPIVVVVKERAGISNIMGMFGG